MESLFKMDKELYETLHRYYTYSDGELINKRTNRPLAMFLHPNDNKLSFRTCITMNGKRKTYTLAHLIYCFHHGFKPRWVRYIDGNEANCRIENLEAASFQHLIADNFGMRKNKTGYQGVVKCKGKYYGRIMIGGKFKWIKSRDNPKDAHQDYLEAKKVYLESIA